MYCAGGTLGGVELQGAMLPTAGGIAGTRQTLERMRQLADVGRVMPSIRQKAASLCSGLRQKDYAGELSAIFYYVRDSIRYTRDVFSVETLHSPDVILRDGAGDCDDKSVLLCSMLESIGFRCVFVACGRKPNAMSHVYVRAFLRGEWISLDATEPHPPGWQPKLPYELVYPKI